MNRKKKRKINSENAALAIFGMVMVAISFWVVIHSSRVIEVEKTTEEFAGFEEVEAVVTAYNPVPGQTDDDPEIMASGALVYEGAIACPRALPLRETKVEIDGSIYICEDRTAKKFDGRFDILMFSFQEAVDFGKQIKKIKIYR